MAAVTAAPLIPMASPTHPPATTTGENAEADQAQASEAQAEVVTAVQPPPPVKLDSPEAPEQQLASPHSPLVAEELRAPGTPTESNGNLSPRPVVASIKTEPPNDSQADPIVKACKEVAVIKSAGKLSPVQTESPMESDDPPAPPQPVAKNCTTKKICIIRAPVAPVDTSQASTDVSTTNIHHLKFSAYEGTLLSALQNLLLESYCTDVHLSTGFQSEVIQAHRIILSAFSPYFKSLFSQLPSSNVFPVVIIKDIGYDILCSIVDFCYRGKCLGLDRGRYCVKRASSVHVCIAFFCGGGCKAPN